MRNRLKPKEVDDVLMEVEGRVLPATALASTGQILKLTGEKKIPAWVDDGGSAIPYSENEIETGETWIDNKPIYRKVISVSSPVSTGTETDLIGSPDVDTVIKAYGSFSSVYNNNAYIRSMPIYEDSSLYCRVYAKNNALKYILRCGENNLSMVVVVEYTKPTTTKKKKTTK